MLCDFISSCHGCGRHCSNFHREPVDEKDETAGSDSRVEGTIGDRLIQSSELEDQEANDWNIYTPRSYSLLIETRFEVGCSDVVRDDEI